MGHKKQLSPPREKPFGEKMTDNFDQEEHDENEDEIAPLIMS